MICKRLCRHPPLNFDSEREGDDIDLDFDNAEDAFTVLQSWRVKNNNRIALGSLNILMFTK